MSHAPGVGYNQQGPPKAKTAAPAPVAPPAGLPPPAPSTPAAPAASDGSGNISFPMPTSGMIPGGTTAEKALAVAGILILGLALYSRIKGTSFKLGLTGFSGQGLTASATGAPGTVASRPPSSKMTSRIAVMNPAKVSA